MITLIYDILVDGAAGKSKLSIILFFFFITVRKLATEQIAPLVRKMDEEHRIDDGIRQLLFDNGVSTQIAFLHIIVDR